MKDNTGGRRGFRPARPPRTGLLAIAVGATLLTAAACSSSSSSPQVASLGKNSATPTSGSGGSGGSSSSPASAPASSATQLLDEWASCMRKHGDTGQADPTVDANKVIHVVMQPSVPGGLYGSSAQSGSGPGKYCGTYLTDASAALRGGQPAPKPPTQAGLVKYADCMRANGVSDFPDPSGAGQFSLSAGSENNPAMAQAAKTCSAKTGIQPLGGGAPPPGTIESGAPGQPQKPFMPLSNG